MNLPLVLEALARTLTVPTLLVLLTTPVAAQDRCPYGHEVTGSIPILYGYPVFTPELEQALDRGELVLGGCEVSGDSPSHVAVCQRCGFRHEVDEIGPIWRRSSEDVASFEIPLPAFLLDVRSRLAPDGPFLFQVTLSDPGHGGWITVGKRPRGRFFVGFAWAKVVEPKP